MEGRPNVVARTLTIERKLLVPLYHYSREQKRFLASPAQQTIPAKGELEHAAQLVRRITELGPTFIKFGQILATRSDILPQSYLDALSTLHDEVPPAPFDGIRKEIEEDLGPINSVFASLDPVPIASASLGQVHHATLIGGREVVVKVRRPGVEETISTDITILRRLTPLLRLVLESFQAYLFETIVTTFSQTIFEEMDYKIEAENQLRIRANLIRSGAKDVLVPNVVTSLSTHRVLVMDYEPGIKITDVAGLAAIGLDRREIAKRLNHLYLEMVINHDVYHADPHPGNLAVKNDGTLVLYDYGMVGRLSDADKRKILSLYYSMMLRDTDKTIARMTELGLVNPETDPALVRAGIELSFRTWEGKGLDRTGLNELIRIANATLHSYPVHLTPEVSQLMKTSQMQDGIAIRLDPHFNLLDNLLQFEERSGHLEEQISEDVDEMVDEFWDSMSLLPRFTRVMYRYFSDETLVMEDVLKPPTRLRVGAAVGSAVATVALTGYLLYSNYPVAGAISAALGAAATTLSLMSWKTRARRRVTR